jgi:hypothetical protein
MNTASATTFQLKVENSELTPDKLNLSDLVELLKSFEDLVTDVVVMDNPMLRPEEIVIGLVKVGSGSTVLDLQPQLALPSVAAFNKVTFSLEHNDYTGMPSKARRALVTMSRFARTRQCDITLAQLDAGKPIHVSKLSRDLVIPAAKTVQGETVIYGEVRSIGGKEPNVHIRSTQYERELVCDLIKPLARELAKHLYQQVGLRGVATWELPDMSLVRFAVEEIIPQTQIPLAQTLKSLPQGIIDYYNHIDDPVAYVRVLRAEEDVE